MRASSVLFITLLGCGIQAGAQTPCPDAMRLRDAATHAWTQAMRAPPSERCAALYRASQAAQAALDFAERHREACRIPAASLQAFERSRREAVNGRDNVCAGRPLRPYPPDIIGH